MHFYLKSKYSTRQMAVVERTLELGSGHLGLNSCSVFHYLFDIERINSLLWFLLFLCIK